MKNPNSDSQARPKKHSKTITTWHTSYVQHRQALLKPPRNLKVRSKIKLFLSIIQQVRLPSVQILVRMVEEIEQLEDKTYRELTMSQHLPDAKKIYSNATDQTRTMAAFMYFVLYEQITGLKASQTGCSRDFQCQGTPFKRLVTRKKQPGGPGRSGEQRSKRTLEEVAELEGHTPAKQTRRSTRTPKSRTGKGKKSR